MLSCLRSLSLVTINGSMVLVIKICNLVDTVGGIQETHLPFMDDARFPEDALFIVSEAQVWRHARFKPHLVVGFKQWTLHAVWFSALVPEIQFQLACRDKYWQSLSLAKTP